MITPEHTLYIGSYTTTDQPGIYAFTFDDTTGDLTAQVAITGVANPSFLVTHPNGRWLYAVSETSQQEDGASGTVRAFRCTREPWSIEPINQQTSGGNGPCHLEIDTHGHWLLVSNYRSGSIGVLPILADGALGEMTDWIQHHGSGPYPGRQEGPHTHSAAFTPDGHFAVVADLGIDALLVYAFDPVAGKLRIHTTVHTQPGSGPRHMAFHPDGKQLFVANELANTVTVYSYDAVQGSLHEQQTIATLAPAATENIVADIHISAAGDYVYVSNRGDDSIAVFTRESNGQLVRSTIRPCAGQHPRNFAIAPGGRFLVVANQHSNEVVVLPMQDAAKAPGAPVARVSIGKAACVHFITGAVRK